MSQQAQPERLFYDDTVPEILRTNWDSRDALMDSPMFEYIRSIGILMHVSGTVLQCSTANQQMVRSDR